MGFEQSGMELILKDSFSAVGRRYAQAVGQINRTDEQSVKVAALAARARQSYAQTVSAAAKTVKQSADEQRKALRTILDESKTVQTAIDPSKWVKSADAARKTVGDLIPAGVKDKIAGFTQGIEGVTGKLNFLPGSIKGAIGSLGEFTSALSTTTLGIGLAVAAAVALTAAFIGLGMRGAAMRGVVEAFDVSATRAGVLANVLLDDLHAASRGTIADMQLMKQANVALSGAGEQLSQALGREGGLAGLLEIARAQARATGQDVDFLFQSLVSGVKRSSPLLIDNTGLVLKVSEANESYAQSIGKSVDQLSAEEKQIALLNATLAAGQVAVEAYGNRSLTAAERLARINTTITNTLDGLSLAVQPAFELLLAVGETLLNVLVYPIRDILLPIFGELVATIFGPLALAWEGLTSGLQDLLSPALQTIHRWVVLVVSVLQGFGYALSWIVKTAGQVLGPLKDVIKKAVVEPIATFLDPAAFAQRAGNIFGAFAGGVLWAANTMIFPAVIRIAEVIASLLMGSSPPPEGPLSTIDQGAANVMHAWLAGFTGVPLTPVTDMAAAVNAELGSIGTLSNAQAQAMLAQLDAQLQPFIDGLTIAKAKLEALVTPLKEAADILQGRVTKNVKAFFAGDLSAEDLRALDAQNQAVNDRLSAFQAMTDEAELQLAMMQSQQAVQRALLGIQIARTKESAATTAAMADGSSSAAKSSAGGGSATDAATAGRGGAGLPGIDANPVSDFLGVTDEEVQQLWGDIATGFAGGLTENPLFSAQWAQAENNVGRLGDALGKIQDSSAFSSLTGAFNKVFGTGEDSIRTQVSNFVEDVRRWFSEDLPGYFNGFSLSSFEEKVSGSVTKARNFFVGSDKGSLQSTLIELPENTYNWLSSTGDKLDDALVQPVRRKVLDVFSSLIGGGGRAAALSLKSIVQQVPASLPAWLDGISGGLNTALLTPFSSIATDIWNTLTGPGEGTLGQRLSTLAGKLPEYFVLLSGSLWTNMVDPFLTTIDTIWSKISGDEEGTLKERLLALPDQVRDWLSGLAQAGIDLGRGFVNAMIKQLQSLPNQFVKLLNQAIPDRIDIPNALGLPISIDIDDNPIPYVPGLPLPAAKKGAFLGEGLARVHAGETLVSASKPYMAFPARWVTAMETIARQATSQTYRPLPAAQPIIVPASSGQSGMSINQNFYGQADNNSVRRGWYELQALGAVKA